jgi:hypothetical protein
METVHDDQASVVLNEMNRHLGPGTTGGEARARATYVPHATAIQGKSR